VLEADTRSAAEVGVDRRDPAQAARVGPGLADVLAAVAVTLVVAGPMLFTSAGLNYDFTNHLWLAWVAGKELAQTGYPSYFVNEIPVLGVFYPFFAFYGGTLYVLTGAVGDVFGGDVVLAYVAMTTLAILAAYAGTWWLARLLGVRGWMTHAPALTVVTSAYYITTLYGRGAWPELIATSALAPLAASGVYLARTRTWRPLPILAFVASDVIFTGSHNLTLLWGTTLMLLALLLAWLSFGRPRELPYRRLFAIASLGAAGALVNAWFLFPDFAYAKTVAISHAAPIAWATTSFLDTPGVLLDPLRGSSHRLFVQIPDWFLAWALAAGALLLWRRHADTRLRRASIGIVCVIALLLALMMLEPLWNLMPFPFDQTQFPYRLDTYISYAVAVLVMLAAIALQHTSRSPRIDSRGYGMRVALASVSCISIALCVSQLSVSSVRQAKTLAHRSEALASIHALPRTWGTGDEYADAQRPLVNAERDRFLTIDPSSVHADRFAGWLAVPPGAAPIITDITGGPGLVRIHGLERVGHGTQDETIVKRLGDGSGPVYVVIETAHSAPVELGRLISILALASIIAALAAATLRTRYARHPTRPQVPT
jgi:hypothetical protein